MKIRPLMMILAGLAGLAAMGASALALTAAPAAAVATAPALLGAPPDACVCSRGLHLGDERAAASTIYSCQCGALQCVVHAQSGQLQCR